MASDRSREQLIQELTKVRAQLAAEEKRCLELSEEFSLYKKQTERERLVCSAGSKLTYQAEEALRESEAKYRTLFENMSEEVHFWEVVRDKAGQIKTWRLVDVNPPTLKTWGRSTAEEIRGKTTDEIFGPGATDHYMPVVQKIMTEGVPYSFEDYFANLDKYFRFTSVPLGNYFITTGADISDIKKAYEALRESEERWAVTLESIGDAVIASDTKGRVTFMNPVAEKLTGWSLAEAAGKPMKEVFHIINEHTGAVVDDPVRKVLHTGLIVGLANHTVLLRKGGGEIPIDDSGAPIRNGEGRVIGVVLIFRDISERKQAEEALRESEKQFRVLAENLVSAVALINERGEISIVNKAFLRLFDLAEDTDILNVNSRDWGQWQVFDEAGRSLEVDEHPVRKAARTRTPVRDVLVAIQCPSRTDWKWVLISTEPILDAQGNLHRLICTYHDITGRKKAEEALQESEQKYHRLYDSMRDAFVVVGMDGLIQDCNAAFRAMLGYSDEELRRLTYKDLTPAKWHAMEARIVNEQIIPKGTSELYEKEYRRKDGTVFSVELRTHLIRDESGQPAQMSAIVRDITERKIAEEALQQSREDLDRTLGVSQIGWWRLDTRKNALTWSKENHRIFGVPEGTPMSYEFFLSIVHSDDRQYVDTQWQAGLRGEPYDIEHRIIADGRVKWVREKAYLEFDNKGELLGGFGITQDITARKEAQAAVERMRVMLEEGQKIAHVGSWEYLADAQTTVWSDEQCRIYGIDPAAGSPPYDVMLAKHIHPDDSSALREAFSAALRNHAIYEQEHRIVRPDGSVRVLYERALPYFDENGKLVKYMGASLDITERKLADEALHRLNESLERKVRERTADLHAANQMLEERASQLRELAGELTTTEQRERKAIATLLHDGLQQYLVAARMRQSALVDELENHAAKKSAQDVEGLLSESINVSRSLAIELCPPALDGGIMAGLEWLSRFMASKHGLDVELLVETGAPILPENVKVFMFESVRELLLNVVKHSRTLAAKVHLTEDYQRLQVTVSDAGVGFDVTALRRRGSGGGLGLFSIRERIGLVGGSIEIDSSPGNGARFTITVPLAQPDCAQLLGPTTCSYIDTQGAGSDSKIRILLADDHKVIRESLALMLGAEKDFEIVGQAEDGNEALELTQMLRPRIVLMDVTMPNMDGITATRIIAERYPEVNVIGLSLYRADERADEMIKAGAKLYVSKTAPAEYLKNAIRSCVG
jgi:PAS domain S-box-containing protein